MASQGDADLIARLEESSVILEGELERLSKAKIRKNTGPRLVVVPQYDVWKFKWGSWFGIFLAGILLGVLITVGIVSLSESRHETSVVPVLAESAPTPAQGEVGVPSSPDVMLGLADVGVVVKSDPIVSSVLHTEPAVNQKKDVPPASSSQSLLQDVDKMLERTKQGQ